MMKASGIVRRIDELGRVVIPKELRKVMEIKEGDPLEIYTDDDGMIVLKKFVSVHACVICGEANNTTPVKGKPICQDCKSAIASGGKSPGVA